MDDLISRQDAIELIHTLYPSEPIMQMNRKRWEEKYKPYIEAEKALEKLPSAESERKKGKWKRRIVDSGYNADWICSECGHREKTDFVNCNFCPSCGCRMEEGDSDE